MGATDWILVTIIIIVIIVGGVQGLLMEDSTPTIENGPEYPPGANSEGISNYTLLLSHHDTVVMEHNVIRNQSHFVRDLHFTTRIDRPDQQVSTRTDDGDPIDDALYYVNGTDIGGNDYGLEYTRTGYSEEYYKRVDYNVAGYSTPTELSESDSHRYKSLLKYGTWAMTSQTAVDNETHLTTYNYTGLNADTDGDELREEVDSASITIRNDGLIVEYYERGNTSRDDFERHITTTVTETDTVTEPSWLETAVRVDAQDDWNWNECGPNDIDGDGDGLCNEW